jgi:hypothetical protein
MTAFQSLVHVRRKPQGQLHIFSTRYQHNPLLARPIRPDDTPSVRCPGTLPASVPRSS